MKNKMIWSGPKGTPGRVRVLRRDARGRFQSERHGTRDRVTWLTEARSRPLRQP